VRRVPRSLQWSEESCFHLMIRGHKREAIFGDDDDRRAFLDLVARYPDRFGFRVFHYCLMPNHFHLLVKLRDPREVSAMTAGLLRAYVHRGVSGPGIGTSGAARGVAQVPADGRSA
jgi:putative transposase